VKSVTQVILITRLEQYSYPFANARPSMALKIAGVVEHAATLHTVVTRSLSVDAKMTNQVIAAYEWLAAMTNKVALAMHILLMGRQILHILF
jgi:hypothetical protein